jgi:acyl carrier protein
MNNHATSDHKNPQIHEQLLKLWIDLLERPQIGILDNFFDAGGSSMQLIEMLWTVSDRFGKEIDHTEFLKEPSIRKLGELLES